MIKLKKHLQAQTAIELAVFGAIVIFIIGLIVRQSLEAGYLQGHNLKAMRLAMKTSYEYSEGLVGGMGSVASHNRASVLFIEDRLTADSSKFGATDRIQHIASGSASFSRNLFMPIDANDTEDLPIYDVFINGRHFPFVLAGFKTINLAQSCAGRTDCNLHPECKNDCSPQSVQLFPGSDVPPGAWELNCANIITTEMRQCRTLSAVCSPTCTGGAGCPVTTCSNCSASSFEVFFDQREDTVGCAKLLTKAFNHPRNVDWCDHDGAAPARRCAPACSSTGPVGCNLPADDRFNLNRQGPPDVPNAERPNFSWQWLEVMGFNEENNQERGASASLNMGQGINFSEGKNISLDIDGDLKEETIVLDTIQSAPRIPGIITQFAVIDSQSGDLDFTIGDNETDKPKPGLMRDLEMYSFVRPGTYYTVQEGALFGPEGQFIRNVSKKDQIDVISRIFQLSNNTGRFCYRGSPTDWGNPPLDAAGRPIVSGVAGMTNPVEACNNCRTSTNIQKNCMDETSLLLFMRSRVSDAHGRKWITETTDDESVDFVVPQLP